MISNMKIGVRLGCAFGVIVLLIVGIVVLSLSSMAKVETQIEHIVKGNSVKLIAAQEASDSVASLYRAIDMIVLEDKDAAAQVRHKESINTCRSRYQAAIKALDENEKSEQGRVILEKIKQAITAAKDVNNSIIELAMSGKNNEAHDLLLSRSNALYMTLTKELDEMAAYQKSRIDFRYTEARSTYSSARNGLIAAMLAALVIAAIFSVTATRSITVPLNGMVEMLKDIASGEGDLTKRLDASRRDEVGEASHWFNAFIERLHAIISNLAQTSSQIASASGQLRATAEQIAAGAEEVASQTSTVATASEEMSATSSDIARNCSMAAESSRHSSLAATRGSAVVQDTINGMVRIADQVRQSAATVENLGQRSEQIGQIVGTIEDIADQTNLLALNAAIEAARAGEQGRGFAVVADEVRALAERTTRATKEISDMIKTIQHETKAAVRAMEEGVSEVEKGAASSEKSGQALAEILEQINEVTHQINQIATAAEQQTATTCEITQNVQQVTEVVCMTARGASETAVASSQLAMNAHELQDLVRKFRLA